MIGKPGAAYNSGTMRFELGDPDLPRGHALLYFRDPQEPLRVWATYLVVPPIAMDIGKYIPPLLAAQLPQGLGALGGMPSVYPLPPFPEAVESHDFLLRLARLRGDDLVDGGTLPTADLHRLMLAVTEASEWYGQQYREAQARQPADDLEQPRGRGASDLDVDAILLDVMTPAEKVGRLARALGTLRYALDGGDQALAQETLVEMEKVGRRLEAKYRVDEMLAAAREPGERGSRLGALYAERCYKLAAEDYAAVGELERRIAAVQAEA